MDISHSWYKRFRVMVSLSLLVMMLIALLIQTGLASGALHSLGMSLSLFSNTASFSADINTSAHLTDGNASQRLVRISQLDPAQYSSPTEYSTWAYSACSTAAMTEVFNAYGMHLRITNVLAVEARIGEITPDQGMLRPQGIGNTSAQFGFKTQLRTDWTLDQIIAIANGGHPVIVDYPPDRYAGGHLLVLRGGDANYVYLADSSAWNRGVLTRAQFLAWWAGYGAVVTPK